MFHVVVTSCEGGENSRMMVSSIQDSLITNYSSPHFHIYVKGPFEILKASS
jgi:hypothetical protein